MCSNCRDYEGPYDDNETELEVLDLQSRGWRNVWWSLGLLIVLYCCFGFPKWMRAIFQ